MMIVYYGVDGVSIRDTARAFATKNQADLQILEEGELPSEENSDTLFGNAPIWLARGIINSKTNPKALEKLQTSPTTTIIIEEKLTSKQIESLPKGSEVKEFSIPNGKLVSWIIDRCKKHGASCTASTAQKLVTMLEINEYKGINSEDVWRLEQEIQKLSTYSKDISVESINLLVPKGEGATFGMVDMLLGGNTKAAMAELEKIYFTNKDDSGTTLLLVGGLADTLRGARLLQTAQKEKISESKIVEEMKWPSWKVTKLKKLATTISSKIIQETLQKLTALDEEIKTSGLPPRVVFELIVSNFKSK
jgi:DNA polymerase III delta subunit